ncbi:MAG TPA: hypothetical protein VE505_12750 [Vicinamibacterales bacterium]|nr:hypothetical protein [Vicinamibacterales bacterium]
MGIADPAGGASGVMVDVGSCGAGIDVHLLASARVSGARLWTADGVLKRAAAALQIATA